MDDAIRKSIEASITKLPHDFPQGLTTSALTDAIDEAEAPLQVSTVLKDMGRRGLVQQNAAKAWVWAADKTASALPPVPEKKLHETAEAILAAFVGHKVGTVLSSCNLRSLCSKWAGANVDYHIKALKKAGLLVPAKNGGYHLPGVKPVALRAKAEVRRPNTALLPGGRKPDEGNDPPPPAAIPMAATAATPAPAKDITIELTCPNGRLKIDGTPKLVFGFLEQLKELAA